MGSDLDDLTKSLLGGVLVLRDNDWEDCAIDGMRGEWRRLTKQGTRGFFGMTAGRHHVATQASGQTVVLDLVLYPGETLIRRFDRDEARYTLDDPETEGRYFELARGGGLGSMASALVDYTKVCVAARGKPADMASDDLVRRVGEVFLQAAAKVAAGSAFEPLGQMAYRAGVELIGQAMLYSQIQRLVGLCSMTATQHAVKGNYKLAAEVTLLGLAVLPGEPWLLDLLANLYSDGGLPKAGLACSEEALRRAHVFPEKLQKQMQSTYLEVSAAAREAEVPDAE